MPSAKHFILATPATVVAAIAAVALLAAQSAAQVVVQPAPAPVQIVPTPEQAVVPVPAAQTLPNTPVVDVAGLMKLFNRPLFLGLKEKMALAPGNDTEWDDLVARGLQAAEISNLLAMRKVQGPVDVLQTSAQLRADGVALAEAAKARQWDATQRAYVVLVERCNDCHRTLAPDKAPQLKP